MYVFGLIKMFVSLGLKEADLGGAIEMLPGVDGDSSSQRGQ